MSSWCNMLNSLFAHVWSNLLTVKWHCCSSSRLICLFQIEISLSFNIFSSPAESSFLLALNALWRRRGSLCHIRAVTQVPLYSKSFQQPPPLVQNHWFLVSSQLCIWILDGLRFSSLGCGVDTVGVERIYRCIHASHKKNFLFLVRSFSIFRQPIDNFDQCISWIHKCGNFSGSFLVFINQRNLFRKATQFIRVFTVVLIVFRF